MNISRIAKYILIGGFAYLAWEWVGVFFVVCLFFWRKGWTKKDSLIDQIAVGLKKVESKLEEGQE